MVPAFAFRGSGNFRILLKATSWTGLNFLRSLIRQSVPAQLQKDSQRDKSVIWVVVLYGNVCRWFDSRIRFSVENTGFEEIGDRCSARQLKARLQSKTYIGKEILTGPFNISPPRMFAGFSLSLNSGLVLPLAVDDPAGDGADD